jgi:hypothetical protein
VLSLSHGLTGAFFLNTIPSPLIGAPAAVLSHYLEDWIPHWDVGTGLSSGRRKRQTAILMELIDLGLTLVLVYVLWQHGHASVQWRAWLGCFLGILPDFLEAPRNFLKWEPAWLKPINAFHGMFHHSTHAKLFGLLPQAIVIGAVMLLR